MKLSLFGFSVFIAVTLLFASWGLNTHFSSGPLKSNITIIIPSGIGSSQIIKILTQRGVLNQPFAFKLTAKLLGKSKKLRAGEYFFEDGISLDIDDVIFEGSGINDTILNFGNQISGAQGLLVTSDGVTLRDFAVLDATGDAIKVIGADGINMVRLRTEWTGGPKETNGAYGFYPVESRDVLIDACVAIGASDAGIYVGQSRNIIVKNSIAQYNVAGIEIENSYYADVFDNLASHNTGGILVFDLPDLPQQGGHNVRVFRNKAINNDTCLLYTSDAADE